MSKETMTTPEGTTANKAGGRPSKLTPDVQERLCAALRAGKSRTAAARAVGISRDTFYTWLDEFSDFSDAIKGAEGAPGLTAHKTPGGIPERPNRTDAQVLECQLHFAQAGLRALLNGGLVTVGVGKPPKCAAGCAVVPVGTGQFRHSDDCILGQALRALPRP